MYNCNGQFTLHFQLNEVEAGGATAFPQAGVHVPPVKVSRTTTYFLPDLLMSVGLHRRDYPYKTVVYYLQNAAAFWFNVKRSGENDGDSLHAGCPCFALEEKMGYVHVRFIAGCSRGYLDCGCANTLTMGMSIPQIPRALSISLFFTHVYIIQLLVYPLTSLTIAQSISPGKRRGTDIIMACQYDKE